MSHDILQVAESAGLCLRDELAVFFCRAYAGGNFIEVNRKIPGIPAGDYWLRIQDVVPESL